MNTIDPLLWRIENALAEVVELQTVVVRRGSEYRHVEVLLDNARNSLLEAAADFYKEKLMERGDEVSARVPAGPV